MENNIIGFDINIGRHKPETIVNKNAKCPFCDYERLEDIIDTCGEMTLLKNKYNVLENAFQTVLLETRRCGSDMPDYTKEHMRALIHFGVKHWQKMLKSGQYTAVLFFKNYGPLSGGTMRHPHMQIIGLKDRNLSAMFDPDDFVGIEIAALNGVRLTLSTKPRLGFTEFNIVMKKGGLLDTLADFIKICVHFLMKNYGAPCSSYNIFFYHLKDGIAVKIMPRFATSPLFIGYNLRLRPNNLAQVALRVKRLYFSK